MTACQIRVRVMIRALFELTIYDCKALFTPKKLLLDAFKPTGDMESPWFQAALWMTKLAGVRRFRVFILEV